MNTKVQTTTVRVVGINLVSMYTAPQKYRAWDVERKIMYSIAFPSWNGSIEVWKDNKPQTEIIHLSMNGPEEQGILLQFTGREDKNDKMIFGGHIVRCLATIIGDVRTQIQGVVKYSRGAFYVCGEVSDDYIIHPFRIPMNEINVPENKIEIIGNIFSNLELIKDL